MNRFIFSIFLTLLAVSTAAAQQSLDEIIVSQTGSGQFRSIQDALNSIPADNARSVVIFIKNGTYNEKLFIAKSHVALVGERRDSTRIVYAELRSNWTKAPNTRTIEAAQHDDWGAAVVNIGDNVTDVILANLTMHNNYGSLHGNNEHQFAVRGFNATRIAILYCTIRSDGGDALSLWNPSGIYYHANCSFEGWVDYVCPRGSCYITDSKFYGHNLSASLWHDGSYDKNQKFVIRNSAFDGVQNFPLGRHHRDAQLYLIDCTFSATMADRPIYSPKSPNVKPWLWGARHYFHNSRRDGGAFAWLADNLSEAKGALRPNDVTAAWTFGGTWDPEAMLPSVLPFAAIPQPRNGGYEVSTGGITLRWIAGRNATQHRIYFGNTSPPPLVATHSNASYTTGRLKPSTVYSWRVDEVTPSGIIPGDLWQFTTDANRSVGRMDE